VRVGSRPGSIVARRRKKTGRGRGSYLEKGEKQKGGGEVGRAVRVNTGAVLWPSANDLGLSN